MSNTSRDILLPKRHTDSNFLERGILADTESVRYVISSPIGETEECREYLCAVFVGEAQVVEVDGGVSLEEIKTKAAEVGPDTMSQGPSEHSEWTKC
jgi:hypothetical protein